MKAHAAEAMPITFLAMHEEKTEANTEVIAVWEEVSHLTLKIRLHDGETARMRFCISLGQLHVDFLCFAWIDPD